MANDDNTPTPTFLTWTPLKLSLSFIWTLLETSVYCLFFVYAHASFPQVNEKLLEGKAVPYNPWNCI